MAQTSVEWYIQKVELYYIGLVDFTLKEIQEKAKEMHKAEKNEDMRKAFKIGHQVARQGSYNDITEQEDFYKWKELGYPINFIQYKKQ